ncbi:MAG: hypothetical protein L0229_08185 [Blastocatellia bacterium]|nr:hypothetical protein [Blastocatellia bacterium]
MFPRYSIGNPFQQFGAISPFQQLPMGMVPFPAWQAISGINPYVAQGTGSWITPFAGIQGAGAINPLIASQFGANVPPFIHPAVAAQLAQVTHTPHPGYLPGSGVETNPLANIFGQPTLSPGDPLTNALIAQQLNPLAGQQLPIRPLISNQPVNPWQQGAQYGFSPFPGQVMDPYAILLQAYLISQLSANPYQQAARAVAVVPGLTQPVGPFAGQNPSFPQQGGPFSQQGGPFGF